MRMIPGIRIHDVIPASFTLAVLLAVTGVWGGALAARTLGNPFENATGYVNPDYAARILELEAQDISLVTVLREVASQPTAVWLDSIETIDGNNGRTLSLEQHLVQAELQSRSVGKVTFLGVIYNLPDRDCAAHASNGTLQGAAGLLRYKQDYIDRIAEIFADPRFASLDIALVIEPDSLPNLVTNQSTPGCSQALANGTYSEGIAYALSRFASLDNVYSYLDIGHSGWLGWDNNRARAVQLYTDVVRASGSLNNVQGVASNVSGYSPLEEILMPDPDFSIEGRPLMAASFYEYNRMFGERRFAMALRSEFIAMGFPDSFGVVIDTSRNGWGGDSRPETVQWKSHVDSYVDAARLDQRASRGHWCNQSGAGLGERPKADPYADGIVHAFLWIKPPGESDGTSDVYQTQPDEQGKSFDPSCDPAGISSKGLPTGALPDAPAAGEWFPEQLYMLIRNAFPAIQ